MQVSECWGGVGYNPSVFREELLTELRFMEFPPCVTVTSQEDISLYTGHKDCGGLTGSCACRWPERVCLGNGGFLQANLSALVAMHANRRERFSGILSYCYHTCGLIPSEREV